MNNKILKFYLFSILFTIILGTILHFTFNLFDNNLFVASFSSTNESTWEHLKLIFFPMLFTIIISYFYLGDNFKSYLCAKTLGIVSSMAFITIFFYTYTGILGYNIGFINIISFIVAVILSEYIAYLKMKSNYTCNIKIPIAILIVLFISFVLFTYFPLKLGYFKDPISNNYGLDATNK